MKGRIHFFLQLHCPTSRYGTYAACTCIAQRNPGISSSRGEEKSLTAAEIALCRIFTGKWSSEKYRNLNIYSVHRESKGILMPFNIFHSRNQTWQIISQHKSVCNACNATRRMLIYTSWESRNEFAITTLQNQSLSIQVSASAPPHALQVYHLAIG